MSQLLPISSPTLPALVAVAGERAGIRFFEFFAANIATRTRAAPTLGPPMNSWPGARREYLTAYLDSAGLRADPQGPLFRTIGRGSGQLTRTALLQANAYAMIGRGAAAAGIATKLSNHSFRATGIAAYLKNGDTLEKAAAMANHASTRTTKLYDLRRDEVSLDEVERIVI
jgi:integrase